MTDEQILLEKWRTLSPQKQQKVFEFLNTLSQEELAEPKTVTFQPKTLLGKKLMLLRVKALADQPPLKTWEELETEIAQRRFNF